MSFSWKHHSLALAFAAAASFASAEASAWTGLDVAPYPFWGSIPVKWYSVSSTFPPEIKATAQQRLVDGFTSWGTPDCTYFEAQFVSDLPSGKWDQSDGKNILMWINKPDTWPSNELGPVDSVIGVTLPVWSPDAKGNQLITDADIVFNNVGFCWFDSKVPGSTCTGGSPVDVQSIATHEEGHFLGLGHTDAVGATMQAFYDGGNSIASIEQDDIDGVCAIYPAGGQTVSAAAGGVACDPCRIKAANNECVNQTKACTGGCLGMYNCAEACPTTDATTHDQCVNACAQQYPNGVDTYTAYATCICNVCAQECSVECGGSIGSGSGGAGGEASGAWNSDDPAPVVTEDSGCGCAIPGDHRGIGALAAMGAALVAFARRRKRQ